MSLNTQEITSLSEICINRCGGVCCNPWWGIITYPIVKTHGLSNLSGFKTQVLEGILEREKRIVNAYITREKIPRQIFTRPERYNVRISDISIEGTTLKLTILAMFGFTCRYLSANKTCSIHPATLGGADIRPIHCAKLGSPEARSGEEGYCRIIYACVESGNEETVEKAIEVEKETSARHFQDGVKTANIAADRVIEQLKKYADHNLSHLTPRVSEKKQGRNDPCPCGSGRKFKKCCWQQ